MKHFALVSFIGVAILFNAACIPSLYPLYTESDLVLDDSLIGVWIDKSDGETWTLSKGNQSAYKLLHVDSKRGRATYEAHLVKVEDELFLDVVPVKSDIGCNSLCADRFIATHTFLRILKKDSALQISYLEPRWLKDHLASKPESIRHQKVNGEIVLTSSPKETQAFLLAHINDREAFSTPGEFTRRSTR